MASAIRSALSRLALIASALALAAVNVIGSTAAGLAFGAPPDDGTHVDVSVGEYLNQPDIGPVRTTPWIESHMHHGLGCTIVFVPDDPTRAPQVLVDDPRVCGWP